MPNDNNTQITIILNQLDAGQIEGQQGSKRLFDVLYGELHNLAASMMRSERSDHTLQATALVHEAFLRLVGPQMGNFKNRAHFFGAASRAMRQILVDHARGRGAIKRGGLLQKVTLTEDLGKGVDLHLAILTLDDALNQLVKLDQRMVKVVELRIFAGLKMTEIAEVLNVSRSTAQKDWRVAKMWLARELDEGLTS